MKKEPQTSHLHKVLATASASNRSESIAGYGRFWDAYTTAGEVLYELVEQGAHDPTGEVPENASKRISLIAGLLQSTAIVEHAITCGCYWAASALLRQHMEALARVIQIRVGRPGTEKKPPNVGVLPFGLAQNYGRLSELVHVANDELLGDFSMSEIGDLVASPLPRYRKDWANNLLAAHTGHMITLAVEIHFLHTDIYQEKELIDVNARLSEVAKILEELGHWKGLTQNAVGVPELEPDV